MPYILPNDVRTWRNVRYVPWSMFWAVHHRRAAVHYHVWRALSRVACTIMMSTSAAFVLSTNQSAALSPNFSMSVRMLIVCFICLLLLLIVIFLCFYYLCCSYLCFLHTLYPNKMFKKVLPFSLFVLYIVADGLCYLWRCGIARQCCEEVWARNAGLG